MSKQLAIQFPLFGPGVFREVKKMYAQQAEDEKEEEIKHLKRVIAAFKGWKTKRNKPCKTQNFSTTCEAAK